jgi:DNA topoisomerase-1
VRVEEDFEPEYSLVPGKKEIIDRLKKAVAKADKIYLATDPDREGEAIAYHVAHLLAKGKDLGRITFHEITQGAIEEALGHTGKINDNLVEAQVARRVLDRLVGYKLSPLLWQKVRKGLSAGRVQSVAVRLIVEREREIEKFVPVEYWEIFTLLKKFVGSKLPESPEFLAKLVKINGEKVEVHHQKESEEIVEELKTAGYEVYNLEKKESRRNPTPPFTTSTLQQTAASRLGWSSKKTMSVAQDLYERGLITYHRTDSTNIAIEAINKVRQMIEKDFGKPYLPPKPNFYKTKSKSAQEAHEAIRPTDIAQPKAGENADQEKLYHLIWQRFVASQMSPAVIEVTVLTVQATSQKNIYLLETRGARETFDGWRRVYGRADEEKDEEGSAIETVPELAIGDEIKLIEIRPEQKFTQPPPRFNEASLIKALEELGIGRPSTYAPTISTILERHYVEKEDRAFVASPLGFAVNDFLVEYFPEVMDYQFTARMEDNLDEIANGERERVPVLAEFYNPFALKLEGVKKVAQRVAVQTEATG